MPNSLEIDRPEAYEFYHGKGVLFRVKSGGRVESWRGKFFVAEDSKWMRIDFAVQGSDGTFTQQHLPIDQEIVESIGPAPKLVQEQFGNQVAFVIQRILPLPPGYNTCRQAA